MEYLFDHASAVASPTLLTHQTASDEEYVLFAPRYWESPSPNVEILCPGEIPFAACSCSKPPISFLTTIYTGVNVHTELPLLSPQEATVQAMFNSARNFVQTVTLPQTLELRYTSELISSTDVNERDSIIILLIGAVTLTYVHGFPNRLTFIHRQVL